MYVCMYVCMYNSLFEISRSHDLCFLTTDCPEDGRPCDHKIVVFVQLTGLVLVSNTLPLGYGGRSLYVFVYEISKLRVRNLKSWPAQHCAHPTRWRTVIPRSWSQGGSLQSNVPLTLSVVSHTTVSLRCHQSQQLLSAFCEGHAGAGNSISVQLLFEKDRSQEGGDEKQVLIALN